MFHKAKDIVNRFFPPPDATGSMSGSTDPGAVTVYRGTYNPTKCWEELSVKQKCRKVTPMPLDTPIYKDKVRQVVVSQQLKHSAV